MNVYRLLADLVVLIHFAYVAFVVVGMAAILLGIVLRWRWVRNFWFRLVHFLMIGVVVAEEFGGVVCPLTTWEQQLRIKAGDLQPDARLADPVSFTGRLVHQAIFFDFPPWVFTLCYCLFGVAVVAALIIAPPRWPARKVGCDKDLSN